MGFNQKWPSYYYLLLFDKDPEKMAGFIIAWKLYIRMRMRKKLVEKQAHWILTYI